MTTRIGILGYGEAGAAFAAALAAGGAAVQAHDTAWARGGWPTASPGVVLCDRGELLAGAEIILSTVTTDAALAAAESCLPDLRAGQIYCDLNSTAPEIKRAIAARIAPSGAAFVEGAVLGAIGVTGARTRILLGGRDAAALSETLNALGLDTVVYGVEIGRASTYKMLRSVFSKGMEALLIEFLLAGRAAGLEKELWDEVAALFDRQGFAAVARNWLLSHPGAHARRHHEMRQVGAVVEALGVEPLMTDAATRVFARSVAVGLGEAFGGRPEEPLEVIDELRRRLAAGGRAPPDPDREEAG